VLPEILMSFLFTNFIHIANLFNYYVCIFYLLGISITNLKLRVKSFVKFLRVYANIMCHSSKTFCFGDFM
jgi:hypothetical protein